MKYFVGIDPSYSKTGVCMLNLEEKTVLFKSISPEGTNKTYRDAIERASYIAFNITTFVIENKNSAHDEVHYVLEEPMVTSMMASRLGILSGVIASRLLEVISDGDIHTINPVGITQLNSVAPNKDKLNKKQLSLKIANDILSYLESVGFKIHITPNKYNKDGTPKKRKLSHDESEALLLALLLVHHKEQLEYEHWKQIYIINKGFYTKDIKINKLH